jgi:hypothetical protein
MAPSNTNHANLEIIHMHLEHEIVFETLELLRVDGQQVYVVDRVREELRSLEEPTRRVPLVQRQFGSRPDGELEVLERYADDDNYSVVVDASPAWLSEIARR